MKSLTAKLTALICLLVLPTLWSFQLRQDDTVIYLVRHAEKDLSNPANPNPTLTPAGQARARHLAEKLSNVGISAVYTTDFIRTVSTVTPLAQQLGLRIQYYKGTDYPAIRQVFQKEQGKTMLVCGHSDNLLPIIRWVGATPPVGAIADYEYDNLFRLVIHADGTADVTVEKYK